MLHAQLNTEFTVNEGTETSHVMKTEDLISSLKQYITLFPKFMRPFDQANN